VKKSFWTGLGFGLTSGVITPLGLLVGLSAGTNSSSVVVGGLLIIALADALSDSLGIHVSQEAGGNEEKSVWEATVSTFLAKFLIGLSFVVPVLFLDLSVAVFLSVLWGFSLLAFFSFKIAKENEKSIWKTVGEHLIIGFLVVLASSFVGSFVSSFF